MTARFRLACGIAWATCALGLQALPASADSSGYEAGPSIPEGQLILSACIDDQEQTFTECTKVDGGIAGTGVLGYKERRPSELYAWTGKDEPQAYTSNGLVEHGRVVWSPDRSRFLVSADPAGDWEECRLYLVRVHDRRMRPITPYTELACPTAMDWSPDGEWILMTVYFHDGPTQLYKVRPDGSGLTDLTCFWSEGQGAYGARWIDGGRRIVYEFEGSRASGIQTMAPDGSQIRSLVKIRWRKERPRYLGDVEVSPDGQDVAYVLYDGRSGTHRPDDVFMVGTDGSPPRRITRNKRDEMGLSWSPQGRRLAITEGNAYDYEEPRRIRILGLRDRSSIVIDDPPEGRIDGSQSMLWSPSGRYMEFTAWGDEGPATYISSTRNPQPRRITPFGADVEILDWTR
jgi:Tol biopolymer transport system component